MHSITLVSVFQSPLYNPYNHSYQTQLGVDLVKKSNPGLHGLTRVNLKKLKKIEILIFHMKN
jgi:hypothetical protein